MDSAIKVIQEVGFPINQFNKLMIKTNAKQFINIKHRYKINKI